jgi:hypothetical protein
VFLTGVPDLNMPEGGAPSEMQRLNMSIPVTENPERLGVLAGDTQGFPNGRRLTDDVVDIELQVVMGELVGAPNDLSDAVDTNDKEFSDSFPYLALPHSGSAVRSSSDPDANPSGGVDTGLADTGRPAGSDGPSLPVIPVAVLVAGASLAGVGIARSKRAAAAKV